MTVEPDFFLFLLSAGPVLAEKAVPVGKRPKGRKHRFRLARAPSDGSDRDRNSDRAVLVSGPGDAADPVIVITTLLVQRQLSTASSTYQIRRTRL